MRCPARRPLFPAPRLRTALACLLALGPVFVTGTLRAAEPLPPDTVVQPLLADHPQWQSLLAQREAERAQARQIALGDSEWSVELAAGQRRYRGPSAGEPGTREWRTGLSRPWRLPAQQAADQATSQAWQQLGDVQLHAGWHGLLVQLLEQHTEWLLARRQADIWSAQEDTAEIQRESARKRVMLGDAARMDLVQAEAAHAQALAQAAAAKQRVAAIERQLLARFARWPVAALPSASDSWLGAQAALATVPERLDAEARAALAQALPSLQAAAARLALSAQQARQADAARIAPPTVGVAVTQDRSGAEQALLLQLNWPLGGAYRAEAARAQQARYQAASAEQVAVEAQADAALVQRWQDTRDAMARWAFQRDAQTRLEEAAQALDKGYRMGEGQLDQVLQARRLAREQALQAAQSEAEAWLALWRWQLDSGARWTAPQP